MHNVTPSASSKPPESSRGFWMSIRVKFSLLFLTILLIAFTTSTALIINKTGLVISYVKTHLLREDALSLRNRMTSQFQQASKELVLLAALPNILQGIELSPEGNDTPDQVHLRLALNNLFNQAKVVYTHYTAFWLMNAQGAFLAGALTTPDTKYYVPSQEYLNAILAKNTVVIADNVPHNTSNERLLPIYLKVLYNGQVGILAGALQISEVARHSLYELQRPHINTLIMNNQGKVISSLNPELARMLNANEVSWITHATDKISGTILATIANDQKKIAYHHIPQTDLYAVVIADSAYMSEYMQAIEKNILIIGVCTTLFLIACIFIFLRPLTLDIKRLSLFAKEIKKQKQTTALNMHRNDELGDLAHSLTDMVATLTTMLTRTEAATKAKSEFLAHMSHEIRTPMNAIIGMTYLAQQANPDKRQKHFLHRIESATKSLLAIINDILDFSKLEANKMELDHYSFTLTEVFYSIQNLLDIKAEEKNIHITYTIANDVPNFIEGDLLRLSQICINLVSNAIKFTDVGTINLHVSIFKQHHDFLQLLFTIKDTGIGIDTKAQQQIFNSFAQADSSATRRYAGTGLGLAISKSLVHLMGGQIWVESELDKGSSFYFTIRTTKNSASTVKEQALPKSNDKKLNLHNIYILLVEDNPINQEIAVELLTSMGAIVIVANNGTEAVELWNDTSNTFDMILMDIQMPIMDGFTAAQLIRESSNTKAKHIPIIALTANAMSGDREKSLRAGMNDHITKPFNIDTLHNTLTFWASISKKA